MAEVSGAPVFGGARVVRISLVIMALGAVLCALGLLVDPMRLSFSYLVAMAYATSLALGALVFLLIGFAMNARWVVAVRRLLLAITAGFPALAVLFVPVVLGAGHLYAWTDPDAAEGHLAHVLHHQEPYLNVPMFALRALVYFAAWLLIAELLRRWSLGRERAMARGQPIVEDEPPARERGFSSAMLPVVGLTLTFAAIDWLMSLTPGWYSTIFGVYYFAGGFVGGFALLTVLAWRAQHKGPLTGTITPYHFHALGRLMFAFTVFWAYCTFFQAMLIQIANHPHEVVFYLDRIAGSWSTVTLILVLGHFVVPFVVLLPRRTKFRPRLMAAIGGWILLLHYLDVHWLVIPSLERFGASYHWLDLAALAFVGGAVVAFAAWRQRGVSLLPLGDPFLAEGIAYRSPP
jgi:hypothetical protein